MSERSELRCGSATLVAGIGNVFFGDDGFGVAVAEQLLAHPPDWPEGVRVGEYGIRGLHLAYDLLDGCDVLVLIDALPMGAEPGTVALIEVDADGVEWAGDSFDAHSMSPAMVLAMLDAIGGKVGRVVVVGCEPQVLEGMGLSPVVAASVAPAAAAVAEVVAQVVAGLGLAGEGEDRWG